MSNKNAWLLIGALLFAGVLGALAFFPPSANIPQAQPSQTVELKDGDSYDLVAAPIKKEINGVEYDMLAYNGSIPGPTLKVPQGATITVRFTNETDLPNTVHAHGVRLDNAFDGVPDVTQEIVQPGESFIYTIHAPDAGAFWYHPHFRDDHAVDRGLYGAIVVTPQESAYWEEVNREEVVFLDDVLIENGELPHFDDDTHRALMGAFGNVMLTNGDTDYALSARKGEVIRFYVVNSANTRPFNLALDGARMKLVGSDGGAYERETWIEAVLISPSERAVVDVLFPEEGEYAIVNKTPERTYSLGSVAVSSEAATPSYADSFNVLHANASVTSSFEAIRPYLDASPDKRLKLTVDMQGGMMGGGHGTHMMSDGAMMSNSGMMMGGVPEGGIEWEDDMGAMNAMSDTDMVKWHIVDQETGKKDMDIDWTFAQGKPVKIRIENDANSMHPMQHPIHFHGQRFVVVARDGVPESNLVWKDTVLVKAGETVDIVLDTSNPGVWMAHCHILEHIEAGMMFTFEVR